MATIGIIYLTIGVLAAKSLHFQYFTCKSFIFNILHGLSATRNV